MENLKRIGEMEEVLNECRAALDDLEKSLDGLDAVKEKMGALFAYYGSAEWYEDRDLRPELPPDVAAGVLSEDLIYDEITDARDASFRMLELATDILKNRI